MFDDIVNAGNDMARAVNDAVATGDYSHLSQDLKDSVQRVSDSLKQGGQQAAQNFANSARSGFSQTPYVDLNGADVRVGTRGAGNTGAAGQTPGTNPYGGTNTQGTGTFGGAWTRPNGGRQTPPTGYNSQNPYTKQGSANGQWSAAQGAYTQAKTGQYSTAKAEDRVNRSARVSRIKSGEGKNIALTLVGAIGMAVSYSCLFIVAPDVIRDFWHFHYYGDSIGSVILTGVLAACSAIFTFLTAYSFTDVRNRNFANLIDTAAGNADYISIRDLSARLAMPEKTIRKKIKRVLRKGLLEGGRIDAAETTLMFSDRAYKQYEQAEAGRRQREAEQNAQETKRIAEESRDHSTGQPEVDRVLDQGWNYIRTIRELNDEIPDDGLTASMSNKLYTLEHIVKSIMTQVQKYPDSADDLQMLMDYYLPTTVKLLHAYVDVMNQPAGENVDATKKNIEESMDTINTACMKVLDDMFQNVAWDVSSDINVMKQMMARDGLTEPAGVKKD